MDSRTGFQTTPLVSTFMVEKTENTSPGSIRCIFNQSGICPEICGNFRVARMVHEMKDPDWMNRAVEEMKRFGIPQLTAYFEKARAQGLADDPFGLGRIVRYYGLKLTDCELYRQSQQDISTLTDHE